MDTWELLWRLAATWAAACRSRRAIHAQLLPHIAHVLRCPEILKNVLHVLIVCPRAWASTQGRLVVQAAMRSLDAHASDATRDEIEAELTRFHELHVAEATAVTTTHLLLAGHDGGVAVDAVRVGLPVVSWVHTAVRPGHRAEYLIVALSWAYQSDKRQRQYYEIDDWQGREFQILRSLLTALQVPQPHTIHATLWVLSGHVQGCALALTAMDVGAGHASARELHVAAVLASRGGILP